MMPAGARSRPDPGEDIRALPSDQEAEDSIMAALLLGREDFEKILSMVDVGDFASPRNQRIFFTCRSLHETKRPVTRRAISSALIQSGPDGGKDAIHAEGLASEHPLSMSVEADAARLKEARRRRELVTLGSKMQTAGYTGDGDPAAIIANAATLAPAAAVDWPTIVKFDKTEAPSIPADALPESLRSFCIELARAIQAPFELGVMATIGTVAAAAQGKFRVLVRHGYFEVLCLYLLAVLGPGTRKSSVTSESKRPLVDWEAEQRRIYGPEVKRLQSEWDTMKKAIEKERNKATPETLSEVVKIVQKMEAGLPEIPEIPRLLVDDVTPEELAVFMSKHEDKAAVIEAEAGIFEILTGLYSNGRANLNLLLKSWSGEPTSVDRRTSLTLRLSNPLLTMVLIVQPEVLHDIASKPGFRGKGVLGRFLYCLPRCILGSRSIETPPVDEGVAANYRAMVLNILETPSAIDQFGEPCPYDLRLSDGAYRAWVAFAEHIEREQRDGGTFEFIRDWSGKLPGQAIRLAGIFHVASEPEPARRPIAEVTMKQALTLAAVLADHALAAFAEMGADPAVECAKRIWKWCIDTRAEKFTGRDAYQAVKGSYPKMDQVTSGLRVLEDRAYIRPIIDQGRPGPGRKPSPVFEINPYTHNSQYSHN